MDGEGELDSAGVCDPLTPLFAKEATVKYSYATVAAMALAFALTCGGTSAMAAELKIGFIDAERINRESAPAEVASRPR